MALTILSTGVSIEGELSPPANDGENLPCRLAVCLHPYSWLGGNMNDPVVRVVSHTLRANGYHVLRYNSRGVGRSSGHASFTGLSEVADLEALVDWALHELHHVEQLTMGYSYGALIASMYPMHPSIKTTHIFISYPLGPRAWLTLFHSRTYAVRLEALLRTPSSHVLALFGDQDEFTSSRNYHAWATELQALNSNESDCIQVERYDPGCIGDVRIGFLSFKNVSHFWRGNEVDLASAVRDWTK
ncbi:hypothetical protein FISHEDRAFT_78048 [Fistulina hepatica ATCC 64428]|nr:hypothetical protein FISHEDRAFT_78048 [Fistulina hepatica ATCC 64428]